MNEPRETIVILAELIQQEMLLEEGVIAIYNQKRNLEPKSGLYIDVAVLGTQPYAANSVPAVDPAQEDLLETQTVSLRETYQIDIFSRNASARLRRIELILSLTGIRAQQAQELHAFQIARVPSSFVDLSGVEGAAILNRYALTVTVLRTYSFSRTSETFTVFQNPPKQLLTNP